MTEEEQLALAYLDEVHASAIDAALEAIVTVDEDQRIVMTKPQAPAPPLQPDRRQSRLELVHELQVHQAELEAQNEELRQTQVNLATARDRFVDLYDFAPVGYFAIAADGNIVEANLTAATLLGIDRRSLMRARFARYVAPACADAWHRHFVLALEQSEPQRIELSMRGPAGNPFDAQLDCLRMAGDGDQPSLRVALTNVSDRHLAEKTRHIAESANRTQEAQRYRVARELHEELGQQLSALKMELTESLPAGPGNADRPVQTQRARVDAMIATLGEAVTMVRRITSELAPLMLRDLGVHAAVEWLAHDVARRSGRRIEVVLDESEAPIAESAAVGLYRLAQDMLEPLARDSDGQAARFEMRSQPGEIVLSVESAGSNWPVPGVSDAASAHAVSDRAHLLGAHVDVQGTGDGHVRLTVRVPQLLDAHQGHRRKGAAA